MVSLTPVQHVLSGTGAGTTHLGSLILKPDLHYSDGQAGLSRKGLSHLSAREGGEFGSGPGYIAKGLAEENPFMTGLFPHVMSPESWHMGCCWGAVLPLSPCPVPRGLGSSFWSKASQALPWTLQAAWLSVSLPGTRQRQDMRPSAIWPQGQRCEGPPSTNSGLQAMPGVEEKASLILVPFCRA